MLTKRIELQFFNEAGSRTTLGLGDPKEDLTDEQVKLAMESILAQDIFTSPRGNLVSIAGARVVAREVNEFIVTE